MRNYVPCISGLSHSLPEKDKRKSLDFKLTQVNEWLSELQNKLADDAGWPRLSEMEIAGKYSTFTGLPITLLVEKLNWLVRSREEALQNILKWQTSPPKLSVFPQWMCFPRFAQRTDFSNNMLLFSARLEREYVKQITLHFIECFKTIQLEIEAIINDHPECMALLVGEHGNTFCRSSPKI